MKTKIIYISGGEIFNMSDVRSAFETVRHELGLGMDTVLFGVPVDAEDALGGKFEATQTTNTETNAPRHDDDTQNNDTLSDVDIAPVAPVVQEEKPKRAKKKSTTKSLKSDAIPDTVAVVAESDEKAPKADKNNGDAVIPILSILANDAAKDATETSDVLDKTDVDINIDMDIPVDVTPDDDVYFQDENVADDTIDNTNETRTDISFDAADIDDEIQTIAPQTTTILDSDDDDNQLEKLLQSVQSLHEDEKIIEDKVSDKNNADFDETDATLEKLANEFAENQDKIVNTTKSSTRGGRIGKLKNILPFKKVKHNDSGLMGDLFGWAGVAANDDDFAIPEFFPTAAKK